MKILVCVKQVIDTDDDIQLLPDGLRIDTNATDVDLRLNYYDTFAIEEAVCIKEARPDVTIDAIAVGPPTGQPTGQMDAEPTLRHALALGADHAIHIQVEDIDFMPADVVAKLIADVVAGREYDLILAGVMSEDLMQGITGPMVAALCGLPCATAVVQTSLSPGSQIVDVACELEGGLRETIQLSLPALLSVQSGINQPRYASLSNRLRAKSQELEIIIPDKTNLPKPGCTLTGLSLPEKETQGEFIEGSIEEKADRLLAILHEKSLL